MAWAYRQGHGYKKWSYTCCNKSNYNKKIITDATIKYLKRINELQSDDGHMMPIYSYQLNTKLVIHHTLSYWKTIILPMIILREANINVVGNLLMPVLEYLNERAISLEEVWEAVNEMKSGKAPVLIWGLYLWTGVVLV